MKTKTKTLMTATLAIAAFCTVVYAQDADVPADTAVSAADTAASAVVFTPAPTAPPVPELSMRYRPPASGPVKELSLRDALQKAMDDNPLVRVERINTDAALSIVREQERLVFDPRVKAAYSTRYRGGTPESPIKDNHDLSAAVYGDLPTGTGFELGTGASAYSSARDPDNNFQNNVSLTVTQALLQGFGTNVNLVPLRKARIDADIRREEMTAYAQRIIADVERAYWDLLFSGEQMNIYKYSLELAQRLLYETEERLKYGSAAPIDLVAIQAEVASRERQLYDAEVAYRQKSLYLIYAMNATDDWDADLVLVDTVATLGTADAVSEHIDAANKFRPDFRQASMLAQKGELDLVQTKNGLLPRLDFFITLSGASPAETFGDALVPGDNIAGVVSGGLRFDMPIRNGAARERHRRSQYSASQQKLSLENYSRLIGYEIRTAHMEVVRARRQVETAATVSALQQQKLVAEQQKMEAGKSTGYAVLQVQRDVVDAHLDEARARTAYIGALITLFTNDGTLLSRRGIAAMPQ